MSHKKNLLLYSGHCEIVGGDAKYLFELINNLNSEKYNIKVYTDINHVFEERAQQWLTKDISIHYLSTYPKLFANNNSNAILNSKLINYQSLFSTVFRLYPFLKNRIAMIFGDIYNYCLFVKIFKQENNIDIFHFNNGGYPGKNAGLFAMAAAKKCGIKNTIMTLQNLPANRQYLWKIPDYYNYIHDYITRKYCDIIITVAANRLQKKMIYERKYPKDRLKSIYHGLEDHIPLTKSKIRIKKIDIGITLDSPVLIITANLEESRKGHKVLFKALTKITIKYPKIILLVVGDGTKKNELENYCSELSLKNNIIFLGHRTDIAELNDIADIAIVPSIGFEGIPYTIREAMRSGKPVITTKAGGCDEAVENTVNGMIVKENDSNELSKAIHSILDNEQNRSKMGVSSRQKFLEKFYLPNKIKEHEELYDNLLGDS